MMDDPIGGPVSALARAADDWIAARLPHFDPFLWASREERYLRRKAFAELAIYCLVRLHLDNGNEPAGDEIGSFIIERVNDPGLADLIMRGRRQFLLYSAAVLYARKRNKLSRHLADAVETVLAGHTVWSCERPPHRMLDLWHFLNGYGHASVSRLDRDAIIASSCLAFPPDPIDCTLSEAYALTHNVLFLHNFGCGGRGYREQPGGFSIDDVVQTQIIRWLAEPNFDIVFELVMTGVLENVISPRLATFAVMRLADCVARDGTVKGPRPPASEPLPAPAIQPEGAGPFMDWALHYHTNLVVASAMRILRSRGPAWMPSDGQTPLDEDALNRLSRVFTDLASYELVTGAAGIAEIDTPISDPIIDRSVFLARQYLAAQRRASGLYGYYLDEAKLHAGTARADPAALANFETDLQRPLSEQIDALIGD